MSEVAKDRLLAVGNRFSSYEQENATRVSNHATGSDTVSSLATVPNKQHVSSSSSTMPDPSVPTQSSSAKVPFWKKNGGKVPGRAVYGAQHPPLQAADAHLATYIKGTRPAKIKSGTSFQDFEGSTLDAWDDDDAEDSLKFPANGGCAPSSSPPKCPSIPKIDKEKEKENLYMASSETASSVSESERVSSKASLHSVASESPPTSSPVPRSTISSISSSSSSTTTTGEKSKTNTLKSAMVSKLSEKLAKVNRNKSSGESSIPQNINNKGSVEGSVSMSPPRPTSPIRTIPCDYKDHENSRLEKFGKLLSGPTTDLDQLRKHSWNGIPGPLRGTTWRLLSGYLPPSIDRRQATLERKQLEYQNFVEQYYPTRLEPLHQETFRQIHIDIPRTNPLIPIFQQEVLQEIFERILFIWAIRHPASGYVQGINDLVVPFFVVFLAEYIDKEVETYNISNVPKDILDMVEADTYWCTSKLLDGIQDNYTFAQPGIQMKVNALRNLVSRINEPMNQHILSHNIDYLQFTFRWMNNLLMRELPLKASIRLWDTYWSEPDGFAIFHLYVCAALLKRFGDEILSKVDFQSLMTFLQNLPCKDWRDEDISCLVSEAYQLKFLFADAPKHLRIK